MCTIYGAYMAINGPYMSIYGPYMGIYGPYMAIYDLIWPIYGHPPGLQYDSLEPRKSGSDLAKTNFDKHYFCDFRKIVSGPFTT